MFAGKNPKEEELNELLRSPLADLDPTAPPADAEVGVVVGTRGDGFNPTAPSAVAVREWPSAVIGNGGVRGLSQVKGFQELSRTWFAVALILQAATFVALVCAAYRNTTEDYVEGYDTGYAAGVSDSMVPRYDPSKCDYHVGELSDPYTNTFSGAFFLAAFGGMFDQLAVFAASAAGARSSIAGTLRWSLIALILAAASVSTSFDWGREDVVNSGSQEGYLAAMIKLQGWNSTSPFSLDPSQRAAGGNGWPLGNLQRPDNSKNPLGGLSSQAILALLSALNVSVLLAHGVKASYANKARHLSIKSDTARQQSACVYYEQCCCGCCPVPSSYMPA